MPYGIVNRMKLKINKAGRIVVPKPLRERLGFTPDTKLEAIEQPAGMLLSASLLEQILNESIEAAGLRSGQPLFQSVS
jgi:AbrB family looped-hinge helix DNA binding protein